MTELAIRALGEDVLDAQVVLHAHERVMNRILGPDPLILGVPPLLGRCSQRDVLDVYEDLVLALLVPHLMASVAGLVRITRTAGLDHPR
jgi:hypothetical protein